jgi:hypothetical protein
MIDDGFEIPNSSLSGISNPVSRIAPALFIILISPPAPTHS